jgi:hypothetical protein
VTRGLFARRIVLFSAGEIFYHVLAGEADELDRLAKGKRFADRSR